MLTPKLFPFITLIFLLVLSNFYQEVFSETNHHENSTISPFNFLNNLKGIKKGQNVKGLNDLKIYLKHFGYHSNNALDKNLNDNDNDNDDDIFDDETESAIKSYQKNFNLPMTGTLDPETLSLMSTPRCGMPDIKIQGNKNSSQIISKPDFKFYSGNPRFQKSRITYSFMNGTPRSGKLAIAMSLKSWGQVGHFTFVEIKDYANADIKFSYLKRNQNPDYIFDGPGGIVGLANPPPSAEVHLDSEEKYSLISHPNAINLYTVTLHEIGHALGLDHSTDKSAIMYPSIMYGQIKNLGQDDIQGIRKLYNI
ncbi:metalloendoproteinase 1-like [Mercurialis annua]|uniref:metalloendoproteinase 1-like n=1 Tax=Mercurialis annua TaxID=3986 RepID=UPI00215FA2CC|nr:metalloendoproteinase 1-like [Mercurialis annua]